MRPIITTVAIAVAATGLACAQDMRRGDTDGDGRLSRAEAAAAAQARFAAVDENADGFVSELEREAAREAADARRAERRAEREVEGERPGRRGRRGGASGERSGDRWERLDTNQDGFVSEAEATSAALSRFDRLDADADGYVTEDEVRAVMRDRRARGSRGGRSPRAE